MLKTKLNYMLIFIVGYIDSGKNKWGNKVAKELGYNLVDTRKLMEEKSGRSYTELLKNKEIYVELEQEVFEDVLKLENSVVVASELLPCRNNNMDRMNEAGKTVFLRAGVGCIMMKISRKKTHIPLLDGIDPNHVPDFIVMELKRRKPFYQKAQFEKLERELRLKELMQFILE